MKKILFVFILMSMLVVVLSAQNSRNALMHSEYSRSLEPVVVLSEGFEGTFPPAGWTLIDADGDGWQWRQWNQALKELADVQGTPAIVANTGLNSAFSQTYINPSENGGTQLVLTPDNWLITPALNIPNGATEVNLSFYVWSLITSHPIEQYSVLISTTNTQPSSFTSLYNQTLNATLVQPSIRNVDLSNYAGNTIYLAFRHHNSTDQFALAIDDVLVTMVPPEPSGHIGLAPKNLTATQFGAQIDRTVRVEWDEPETTVLITYANPLGADSGIGIGGAGQHIVAHRYSVEEIQAQGLNNSILTRVQFWPREPQNIVSTEIKVYIGGNWTGDEDTNSPGTLVHSQPVTANLSQSWIEVILTNPINIPDNEEIWIGVHYVYTAGFTLGCDRTTYDNEYGNVTYIFWDEEEEDGDYWTTLVALNPQLTYNWTIRGVVESSLGEGLVFLGYNVSRGDELLTPSPISSLTFEEIAPQGRNFYYVTAEYNQGESQASRVIIDVITGLEPSNPPRNLSVTNGNGSVELNWQAPEVDPEYPARIPTHYRVYRDGVEIDIVLGNVHTYLEHPLVNGVPYEFYVRAVYVIPSTVSVPSNTVIGTPQGIVPTPFPPRQVASSQFDQNVTISWNHPEYNVPIPTGAVEFGHPLPAGDGYTMSQAVPGVQGSAHRFSPEHLSQMGVAGKKLVGASFWGGNAVASASGIRITIRVYVGGTSVADPGEMIYEQYWGRTNSTHSQTIIDMGFYEPIEIPVDQELRIAFIAEGRGGDGFGSVFFGSDAGTPEWGNLFLNPSGNWVNPTLTWPEITGNAIVVGWAIDDAGQMIALGNEPQTEPTIDFSKRQIMMSNNCADYNLIENAFLYTSIKDITPRSLMTYNVYRGATLLGSVPANQRSFTEEEAPVGSQTYSVSAVYQERGESEQISTTINVIARPLISDFPYFQGFNSGNLPSGWIDFTLSPDNQSWRAASGGANLPYEGSHCVVSLSMQGNSSINPDNWLITPRMLIPEDVDEFWMTYYIGASHPERFSENYSILLSTTTPTVEGFEKVLRSETLTTDEWQKRTLDLKEFAGQTIMLAFRHHDVSGQSSLKLDAITIDRYANIGDGVSEPVRTELLGNFPNPFNPDTTIDFNLRSEGHVSIDIFNIRGQKVRSLVNDVLISGHHSVIWNGNDDIGRNVSSGIYFYRLNADGVSETRRMVLMK
ncbi:MAG: choice-of-anchor J domain-containing protein [Candidatus Cloacimonetes bacterium]|nr:choice-of-anchor J domain-containing protein [Candidatus Cloacimonadota bacterium]